MRHLVTSLLTMAMLLLSTPLISQGLISRVSPRTVPPSGSAC